MQKVIMEVNNSKIIVYGFVKNNNFRSEYKLVNFEADNIYFTNLLRKLKNIKIFIAADDSEIIEYVEEFLKNANSDYEHVQFIEEEFVGEEHV